MFVPVFDASFHRPREPLRVPRTLICTPFQPFKVNAALNKESLPFGQSYWDYLPLLVQDKIMKMVHKSLLTKVHAELLRNSYCGCCDEPFENPFELKKHLLDVCPGQYVWGFDNDDYNDCGCYPYCVCEWSWDDYCDCCGSRR